MKKYEQHAGAIIDALAGIGTTVHPLFKSPCGICREMVCEKDRLAHERGHDEPPHEMPTEEDINAMAALSERQEYQIAHS